MQSALKSVIGQAGETISGVMTSDKKLADLKGDIVKPSQDQNMTSDYGVKQFNTHISLTASTETRQGRSCWKTILQEKRL